MNFLRAIWLRVMQNWGAKTGPPEGLSFQLLSSDKDVLLFQAYAPQPHMTQLALDMVRRFPSPMGLVLVEYRPGPREWLSSYLGKGRTLGALVKIRDLLGASAFDIAVVSPPLGLEVIIDHLGILEVRTGAWNEVLVRSIFSEAGFEEIRDVDPQTISTPAELIPNQDHWRRIPGGCPGRFE